MLKPSSQRPILVVGSALSFRRYYRDLLMLPGSREYIHIMSERHLVGRRFLWEDIVWLWDAPRLPEYLHISRYARHIASIYDSRDGDESSTVCGRGEEPPRTD